MCSLCPSLLVKMSGGGFACVPKDTKVTFILHGGKQCACITFAVHVADTLADQQFVHGCKGKIKIDFLNMQ